MKVKVTLYNAGICYDEIVIAKDYKEARQIALARNPASTVVSVTAVFK